MRRELLFKLFKLLRWNSIWVLLFLSFDAKADIVLKLGQIRPLNKTPSSVLIGSKKIIEIKSGQIIAKKVGETTLSSAKHFEKVNVLSVDDYQLWQKLKHNSIEIENGKILFTGVLNLETYLKLESIARNSHGRLNLKSSVPKNERGFLEKQWRSKIPQYEQNSIAFLWEPYFQIQVSPTINQTQLLKRFSGLEPPMIKFIQKFESQPLIQTLVVMAEINRTEAHSIGISWPSTTDINLVPKITGPDVLLASINALEASGHGKVLAKPILICKSGSEAEFLAGGEFPIRIISRRTHEIQWKQHGILLKVKPIVGLNNQINLVINSEISLLDKANAVEGIPALKTNRVRSEINVPSGQTLALSGLLREDFGTDRSGLFGFASLPILGALFRSENFLKSRSELVVFIIPKIKEDQNLHNFQKTDLPTFDEMESPFDLE